MSRLTISRLNRGANENGFTLIELMAATALMMFLVAMVLQLTGNILTSWNRAFTQLSSNFGARQALDIMATDLESAIVKNSSLNSTNLNWIEIHTSEPDEVQSEFGLFDHIFFFAPTAIRHKYHYEGEDAIPIPGDIAAISYRVVYENPLSPGSKRDRRFTLYRGVVDPYITFTDFLGAGGLLEARAGQRR